MLSSQIRAANPASSTIRQPRRRILYCTLSAVFWSHSRLIPGLSDTIRHSTCLPILFEAVHWHSDSDGGAGSGIHFYSRHPCGQRQLLYPAWWVASGFRFCGLYFASLFMYPNQQLSQPANPAHPSSYTSFHGGHLKFFSKTFTMFFLISSTGPLNFIPFVNSSKTVIFLSLLLAAWRLPA